MVSIYYRMRWTYAGLIEMSGLTLVEGIAILSALNIFAMIVFIIFLGLQKTQEDYAKYERLRRSMHK